MKQASTLTRTMTLPPLEYDPYDDAGRGGPIASGLVSWDAMRLNEKKQQVSKPLWCQPPLDPVPPPKLVHLIYNFYGGGGAEDASFKLDALKLFETLLNEAGVQVNKQKTEYAGHATELVLELPEDCEMLVIWGGDGSLQEAVAGLMTLRERGRANIPPLAVVAGGSGNAFAAAIGMRDPTNAARDTMKRRVERAVEAILRGRRRRMDVGRLTSLREEETGNERTDERREEQKREEEEEEEEKTSTTVEHVDTPTSATDKTKKKRSSTVVGSPPVYFVLIFAWGNPITLFKHAEWYRKAFGLGKSRYMMAAVSRMFLWSYPKRPLIRVVIDDKFEVPFTEWRRHHRAVNEVSVACVSEMMGFQLSPLAQLDDGKFEVNLSPSMSRAEILEMLALQASRRLFVGMPTSSRPIYCRFSKLRVEFAPGAKPQRSTDTLVSADGTIVGEYFPFEIECIHDAIVIVTEP